MARLIDEIIEFLEKKGIACSRQRRADSEVISASAICSGDERIIIPLEISATSMAEASEKGDALQECIRIIRKSDNVYPLIITEDRWRIQQEMMQARLLAHLEIFEQAYARNCEVRRIEKSEAEVFLNENHSYGYAACKYRYGLFLKRHTGHIAAELSVNGSADCRKGKLIAVATFSNARKWIKNGMEIKSYEWTRYASLPEIRVSGGMGKLLKSFIKDVQPDDIMSYADLEWSEGSVYSQLGFTLEGEKAPVMFEVDDLWHRRPYGKQHESQERKTIAYFRNFGSNKYRLKITQYE